MNADKAKLDQLGQAYRGTRYDGDLAVDVGLTAATAPRSRRRWMMVLLVGGTSGLAATVVTAVLVGVMLHQGAAHAPQPTIEVTAAPASISLASVPNMISPDGSVLAPAFQMPSVSDLSVSDSLPALFMPTTIDVSMDGMPTSLEPPTKENRS